MNPFTIELAKGGPKPLYEQIYSYISGEIMGGRLRENEKLPSKKSLAAHLGISQNTVETAYSMLSQEGYVTAKPKSGFYVNQLDNVAPPPAPPVSAEQEAPSRTIDYDFGTNAVDIPSFPYSTWAKLERETLYAGADLLTYGDPRGDYALREAIAKYLHEFRAVMCTPDQIVIGAGFEYLLTVLGQLLTKDTVFAVEDPGYPKTAKILSNGGRDIVHIPLDISGLRPDRLQEIGAAAAYITPSCQFPTGIIMPIGRRTELLRWALGVPGRYLVEDDYNSEFNFIGRPIPSIQGIDTHGKVIYMSTFSRILAPSIRIAYMVLPRPLSKVFREKFASYSSTVSRFEQHTLARFISGGYLNRHLSRVKTIYRKRREGMIACIRETARHAVTISGDSAGLQLLLSMEPSRCDEVVRRAETYNIRIARLSSYCVSVTERKCTVILGFAAMDTPRLCAGIKLLLEGI